MRAPLLALLLLLPLAAGAGGDAPAGDLIVTWREPAPPPPGALALTLLPGFILPDATRADAVRFARDPAVERVDWAKPLERHGAPALPSAAFHGLTRVAPDGPSGRGVTVAVVDSGIDASHPDLAGRVAANVHLVAGRFVHAPGDTDGHGTHVAGVVAASGASSQGRWRGVAPEVHLVGIDISSRFTTASAILAYEWLHAHAEEHGIRVVVNAWGRVPDGEPFDPRDPELRAIERVVDRGIVVLFSASNRGPGPSTLSLEAQHPRVVTVGATDAAGVPMAYSSRGPVPGAAWTKPDVVAPGDAAVGPRSAQSAPKPSDPDALHATYSGTSQAVPHVAGIVARMLEAQPRLTPQDVADMLRASAIDLGPAGPDDVTGHGLVDARDALLLAQGRAPDRANVLLAGGTDRYEDELGAAGEARRSLLGLLERPQLAWETPFPVKPGARELRARAHAAGAAALDVELLKDGRSQRGDTVHEPEPGIWLLRVQAPLGTPGVLAAIETDLPPQPARGLTFDARPAPASGSPPTARDVLEEGALLAVCALLGALAGGALAPRERRPDEE